MSSNNITAIMARFNKKNANIMARLNKINANIANLKGQTRKNMEINSKMQYIDGKLKFWKEAYAVQFSELGEQLSIIPPDNETIENLKKAIHTADIKIGLLTKEKEKLMGFEHNIAGGKRNKKSRRKTRRN